MNIKEIAEKLYEYFKKNEKILIMSGEEIYNLNKETATDINTELNIIDKFLYHGGIDNKKECEKFLNRYEKIIAKITEN